MQTYRIEGKECSPEVYIDKQSGLIEIKGSSTLKETNWFYGNVLKWVLGFNLLENKTNTVNIHLEKINDSSTKWIILIFKKLHELVPKTRFEVNWHCNKHEGRVWSTANKMKALEYLHVNIL